MTELVRDVVHLVLGDLYESVIASGIADEEGHVNHGVAFTIRSLGIPIVAVLHKFYSLLDGSTVL